MRKYFIADGTIIYYLFVNCDKLKFSKSKYIYRGRKITIWKNGSETLSGAKLVNNKGVETEITSFNEKSLGKIKFKKKEKRILSGHGYYEEIKVPNSFHCFCTEEQLESCLEEIKDKTHEFLKKQYEEFKSTIPAKIQALKDEEEKLLNQYNQSLCIFN